MQHGEREGHAPRTRASKQQTIPPHLAQLTSCPDAAPGSVSSCLSVPAVNSQPPLLGFECLLVFVLEALEEV